MTRTIETNVADLRDQTRQVLATTTTSEQLPQGQFVKSMVVSVADAKRVEAIRQLNGLVMASCTMAPRRR